MIRTGFLPGNLAENRRGDFLEVGAAAGVRFREPTRFPLVGLFPVLADVRVRSLGVARSRNQRGGTLRQQLGGRLLAQRLGFFPRAGSRDGHTVPPLVT